ncbi:hypothetical protein [Anaerobacillus alkalilacustris]|uniref:hypothetical protein n=1 Tax=Anaerobacillus alkalilacustris TaxID=393763 RepID=UPI001114506C|nr:hypothetical protein [Anaerobacillus alkalilacustris]
MDKVNILMDETHEHCQLKIEKLYQENKHLKRANSKLKNESKELRRLIHKLKQNKQKNHYKNGKRGTKFNG